MLKSIKIIFLSLFLFLLQTKAVYAADTSSPNVPLDIINFILRLAPLVAVVFVAWGGFEYITSAGNPAARYQAKQTITRALKGLVLIIAAQAIVKIFSSIFLPYTGEPITSVFKIAEVEAVKPSGGIITMIIEAILGFLRAIIESAAKPFIDGLLAFLTSTPTLLDNPTVVKFWLVIFGLSGSLFVLFMVLLGWNLMTGDIFGLIGEMSLKEILLRFGAGMLGAAMSLFLTDTTVRLSNYLVATVSNISGGVTHSWVMNVIQVNPNILDGAQLANLLLMVAYLLFALLLSILYVVRLVIVVTGAVFSPFIFLFLTVPRLQGFADSLIRNYLIAVFLPFSHIVMIQLFAAFLSMPEQQNKILSLITAIGLFVAMLKTPGFLSAAAARGQEVDTAKGAMKKLSNILASAVQAVAKGGGGSAGGGAGGA